MEEADLILDLLKKGEKKGLEKLFQHFYKPLVVYAYHYLKDQAEAEDVVQEVFIKFWKQNKFAEIQSYLRSYLYHSVYNHCLNHLAIQRGSTVSLEEIKNMPADEPEDEVELQHRMENIYAEIEKLPEHSRRIFKAVFIENKRYKEVAIEEHISVNTIKTSLRRSLIFLRQRLKNSALLLFNFIFRVK